MSCQAELRGWLHIAYNGYYILSNISYRALLVVKFSKHKKLLFWKFSVVFFFNWYFLPKGQIFCVEANLAGALNAVEFISVFFHIKLCYPAVILLSVFGSVDARRIK